MALTRPRIREASAGDGHELPVIARRVQRQLQYAVGGSVADLAVGLNGAEGVMARSPGADGKLPDAARIVGDSANAASLGLHRALGFSQVGVVEACGWKFGIWLDMVILQKTLGRGSTQPPPDQPTP